MSTEGILLNRLKGEQRFECFGETWKHLALHFSTVQWCSWLSRLSHIELFTGGLRFEPGLNQFLPHLSPSYLLESDSAVNRLGSITTHASVGSLMSPSR